MGSNYGLPGYDPKGFGFGYPGYEGYNPSQPNGSYDMPLPMPQTPAPPSSWSGTGEGLLRTAGQMLTGGFGGAALGAMSSLFSPGGGILGGVPSMDAVMNKQKEWERFVTANTGARNRAGMVNSLGDVGDTAALRAQNAYSTYADTIDAPTMGAVSRMNAGARGIESGALGRANTANQLASAMAGRTMSDTKNALLTMGSPAGAVAAGMGSAGNDSTNARLQGNLSGGQMIADAMEKSANMTGQAQQLGQSNRDSRFNRLVTPTLTQTKSQGFESPNLSGVFTGAQGTQGQMTSQNMAQAAEYDPLAAPYKNKMFDRTAAKVAHGNKYGFYQPQFG